MNRSTLYYDSSMPPKRKNPLADPMPTRPPINPFEDPDNRFEDSNNPIVSSADPFADPVEPLSDIPINRLLTSPTTYFRHDKRNWEYNYLRQKGASLQRWIRDHNIHCPIPKSTVTIQDLKKHDWDIITRRSGLPTRHRGQALTLGYPDGEQDYRRYLLEKDVGKYDEDCWQGRTARGVIFMENIERWSNDSVGPWMSDITRAVYAQHFPVESLRHIFVANVVNPQTAPLLRHLVKTRELSTRNENVTIWEENDEIFHVLLGTRIGKVVAYLILGAFDRGTRRVGRIAVWHSMDRFQMRFDLA
ncbi:hypothetical protein N7492_000168 [Penicillium capsulatum]|uniref:Uncharacterized protein n=1 Tax=Penicillium capsulatum TaxID=69766 RepID=A0A9W9IR99_9EURO|nr:hypothetical protein N7492_000168 [Penicillium capsulatum]KAJ6130767.1 hypothetical protein N7512_003547 [Penicillium capsulatum]